MESEGLIVHESKQSTRSIMHHSSSVYSTNGAVKLILMKVSLIHKDALGVCSNH